MLWNIFKTISGTIFLVLSSLSWFVNGLCAFSELIWIKFETMVFYSLPFHSFQKIALSVSSKYQTFTSSVPTISFFFASILLLIFGNVTHYYQNTVVSNLKWTFGPRSRFRPWKASVHLDKRSGGYSQPTQPIFYLTENPPSQLMSLRSSTSSYA